MTSARPGRSNEPYVADALKQLRLAMNVNVSTAWSAGRAALDTSAAIQRILEAANIKSRGILEAYAAAASVQPQSISRIISEQLEMATTQLQYIASTRVGTGSAARVYSDMQARMPSGILQAYAATKLDTTQLFAASLGVLPTLDVTGRMRETLAAVLSEHGRAQLDSVRRMIEMTGPSIRGGSAAWRVRKLATAAIPDIQLPGLTGFEKRAQRAAEQQIVDVEDFAALLDDDVQAHRLRLPDLVNPEVLDWAAGFSPEEAGLPDPESLFAKLATLDQWLISAALALRAAGIKCKQQADQGIDAFNANMARYNTLAANLLKLYGAVVLIQHCILPRL